jgi:uncharacterized protein (DUF302 family)
MRILTADYTLSETTSTPFAAAVERVRTPLAGEGFGVLCEIDVRATLEKKLGVLIEPYLILGACNPPLAYNALRAEHDLGALLPCNVVVSEHEGETRIAAIDPERMLSIVDNADLASVAADVRARLANVVRRDRCIRFDMGGVLAAMVLRTEDATTRPGLLDLAAAVACAGFSTGSPTACCCPSSRSSWSSR